MMQPGQDGAFGNSEMGVRDIRKGTLRGKMHVAEEREMCEGCLEGGKDFQVLTLTIGWFSWESYVQQY